MHTIGTSNGRTNVIRINGDLKITSTIKIILRRVSDADVDVDIKMCGKREIENMRKIIRMIKSRCRN